MKKFYFFFLILMLPNFCLADMIGAGCESERHQYFQIENAAAFPGYSFYFDECKDCASEKPYHIHWRYLRELRFQADSGETRIYGKSISGADNKLVSITIEKITNDSIYYKTSIEEINYAGTDSEHMTTTAKILIFISFFGLVIYVSIITFRKKT